MDSYLFVIVALLPLSASMVVFQVNPYHALIIRGILGAVAALVYAALGAADVALTEALVGTMLAITLYAIAVRSSMSMQLGVLGTLDDKSSDSADSAEEDKKTDISSDSTISQAIVPLSLAIDPTAEFLNAIRATLRRHHMRLELIPYPDQDTLHQALMDKEIHGICTPVVPSTSDSLTHRSEETPYQVTLRIRRLYEIMEAECSFPAFRFVEVGKGKEAIAPASLAPEEAHS